TLEISSLEKRHEEGDAAGVCDGEGAQAASCRWKVIRSFIMKSGCRSCALAAASSSALGINRRKITHTSTSIWATPVRSSAPIALRYSISIRAWAHTKLIRQIVLTGKPPARAAWTVGEGERLSGAILA